MSTTINERVSTLETRADDMDARADALEAKGEALRGRTAGMETGQGALEAKVKELDAFAGPGQNQALSDNIVDVRKKLDLLLKNQEKFGERQESLVQGQGEVKATLVEILDRLPARPDSI